MYGNNKNCDLADTNAYGLRRGWFGWVQELGDVCVGINELNTSNTLFNLYPNPVNDIVYIKPTENEVNYTVEVYNAVGQAVALSELSTTGILALNTSALPNGMYILRFINLTTKTYSNEKFIINR
jgi:hypothetical protein